MVGPCIKPVNLRMCVWPVEVFESMLCLKSCRANNACRYSKA